MEFRVGDGVSKDVGGKRISDRRVDSHSLQIVAKDGESTSLEMQQVRSIGGVGGGDSVGVVIGVGVIGVGGVIIIRR
jgi:hypothetical protein